MFSYNTTRMATTCILIGSFKNLLQCHANPDMIELFLQYLTSTVVEVFKDYLDTWRKSVTVISVAVFLALIWQGANSLWYFIRSINPSCSLFSSSHSVISRRNIRPFVRLDLQADKTPCPIDLADVCSCLERKKQVPDASCPPACWEYQRCPSSARTEGGTCMFS